MTTIDIDAIRQREQAATEGPWKLITDSCDCGGEYGCGHGDYPIGFGPFYSVEHTGTEQAHADHEFAAHARTDVPALLAKVAELTAERDAARDHAQAARREAANALRALDTANTQLYAQKPVIEAAEAWAEAHEDRDVELIRRRSTVPAVANLYDAIEQHRLMDLALSNARAENADVAANGCDECSVEPGERHRYPECPGNLRAIERANAEVAS